MTLPCDPLECDPYEVVDFLRGKLSVHVPMRYNTFIALTVRNGQRREWARRVEEVASGLPETVYVAAAHLLGTGPHNAMVEILSESEEELQRLALAVTDIDGVLDYRYMPCEAKDTRGMGTVVAGM